MELVDIFLFIGITTLILNIVLVIYVIKRKKPEKTKLSESDSIGNQEIDEILPTEILSDCDDTHLLTK